MEGTYELLQGGQAVGRVQVTRQGMFYCVGCQCKLSGAVKFRLIMESNGSELDLGILRQDKAWFRLQTRVNVKTAGQGRPAFCLRPQKDTAASLLVPVCPEEPFGYLARLEQAYLVRQNGKMLLGFRDEK
ncbi:MAG: hypothetical protein E7438_00415 [Ruminococcaceae bacterium]|nr:hypothetical protein [Oscillospiraceae bacterium]